MSDKPFAPAAERNRVPLLAALAPRLTHCRRVLEIGSGTGQHAVHFAPALPQLMWQTSERDEQLPGLQRWLDDAAAPNLPPPLALDVLTEGWPVGAGEAAYDVVFTANTLHIMPWAGVLGWAAGLPRLLRPGGRVMVYGPFLEDGVATVESNRRFDEGLRAQAPHMGLRRLEAVDALLAEQGLQRVERLVMPANNLLVVWGPATTA